MNIAKFIVLGTLDQINSGSGYDIIRELDKKMISRWTNVKKGSVYHALKTLAKDGHVLETGRVKQGAFPTMTRYRITESGRHLFDTLQAESFLGLFPCFYGFKLALKFNSRQSPEQIRIYAEQAIEIIDKTLGGMDVYMASLHPSDPRSESDPFFIEHDRMLLAQEKKWIQMAVVRLPEKKADG